MLIFILRHLHLPLPSPALLPRLRSPLRYLLTTPSRRTELVFFTTIKAGFKSGEAALLKGEEFHHSECEKKDIQITFQ